MNYNINALKHQLKGGLKTNKFLIELTPPLTGDKSEKINVLCRSASIPEIQIGTTELWHKGRKIIVRSETTFQGTWTITLLDDADMSLRKMFDMWWAKIDNIKEKNGGIFEESKGASNLMGLIKSGVGAFDSAKKLFDNPKKVLGGFLEGKLDDNTAAALPKYETDITIWQLNHKGEKVHGYKIQNAFPTSIGEIVYSDDAMDTLVTFPVTFTYSEFYPMHSSSMKGRLFDAVVGDDITSTIDSVENIFD